MSRPKNSRRQGDKWKTSADRTEADRNAQRQHLKQVFGTDNEEAQALLIAYGEQRQDQPTEAKTTATRGATKATRPMRRTDEAGKLDQFRKTLQKQRNKTRHDLRAKLERLTQWITNTNADERANRKADQDEDTSEEVRAILNSDLFAKWNKDEGEKYTDYQADTQGETTTLTNKAEVGINQRHHRIPTALYEQVRRGHATVKQVVEAIATDKRNDLPTHYLIQWLGFTEYAIRQYIDTEGREIETRHRQHTVLRCGIPTHYAIRPRTPQEVGQYKDKDGNPIRIPTETHDLRTGRPLQDFKAQVLAQIHRRHRTRNTDTDTYSDISDGSIEYDF